MRNAQCYTIVTGPGPGTGEWDMYSCAHCNAKRVVKPMCPPSEMPDQCHLCSTPHNPAFICEKCRGKGCTPFERQLDQMEKADRKRRLVAQWV